MMDADLFCKLEEHSVGIAKLEESVKNMDSHMINRFLRLEMFFNEVEKNSDFRKKSISFLTITGVLTPIIIGIFILL